MSQAQFQRSAEKMNGFLFRIKELRYLLMIWLGWVIECFICLSGFYGRFSGTLESVLAFQVFNLSFEFFLEFWQAFGWIYLESYATLQFFNSPEFLGLVLEFWVISFQFSGFYALSFFRMFQKSLP